MNKYFTLLSLFSVLILTSCGSFLSLVDTAQEPIKAGLQADGAYVNPFPEGSLEHFQARKDYKKTKLIWRNKELLASANKKNTSIVINLTTQRAQLMNGEEVAMDYPISSGRSAYPTPTGEYKILEKMKAKRSNIYGKIYNAEGGIVHSKANMKKHKIPEGGKYVGASMPYWMRLTWDGVGHHVGYVPRYPASHSCIRGTRSALEQVFYKVKVGTRVKVKKGFNPFAPLKPKEEEPLVVETI